MRACTEPPVAFAEPFCGGSGVALSLLSTGDAQTIALNDLDPLVAAFWQVVFGQTGKSPTACRADIEWLMHRVRTVNITVEEWQMQKHVTPDNMRAAAFKCLFLNRTSFNGILHKAGPIGGWEQVNRKLDVRFNRDNLCERIQWLWEQRERVERVTCEPWRKFFSRFTRPGCFLYLDPPYYHRAEQLYGYLFDEVAHQRMRDVLLGVTETPWLLSYDDSVEVRQLYAGKPGIDGLVIDKTYSAHPLGGGRFVGRELFFSNRPIEIAARDREVDHSAVSVVGPLATIAPPVSGPARLPIQGDIVQRRKDGAAAATPLT